MRDLESKANEISANFNKQRDEYNKFMEQESKKEMNNDEDPLVRYAYITFQSPIDAYRVWDVYQRENAWNESLRCCRSAQG